MIRFLAKGETPAWKRLVAPVRYLAIRHQIKPRYDWCWPLVLTAVTMAIFWLLPVRPALLGDHGILKGVQGPDCFICGIFCCRSCGRRNI